jgi:hypothetical protein
MSTPSRLVVRTYAPWRGMVLAGAAVIFALLALFIAFEWGRSNAGFDGQAARNERSKLREQIRDSEKQVRKLRLELATQDIDRAGQTRERTELARSIGDLQADVARLTRDLEFYRGVVGNQGPAEVLRIQQFRVTRGAAPNQYQLRLVLARPMRPEDLISGKVRMTFEGATVAAPVSLDLSAVSDVKSGELAFSYRFVTTLEQPIQLPPGFTPARTTIEVAVARKGVNPVRETFIWTVENG